MFTVAVISVRSEQAILILDRCVSSSEYKRHSWRGAPTKWFTDQSWRWFPAVADWINGQHWQEILPGGLSSDQDLPAERPQVPIPSVNLLCNLHNGSPTPANLCLCKRKLLNEDITYLDCPVVDITPWTWTNSTISVMSKWLKSVVVLFFFLCHIF